MSYLEQKEAWLKKHSHASASDAYTAGYMQAVENWVTGETGFTRDKNGRLVKKK